VRYSSDSRIARNAVGASMTATMACIATSLLSPCGWPVTRVRFERRTVGRSRCAPNVFGCSATDEHGGRSSSTLPVRDGHTSRRVADSSPSPSLLAISILGRVRVVSMGVELGLPACLA
jgi:hypothetical protein